MNREWLRALATTTMLTTATSQLGCGYFLHPERRGRQSGTIDGATMVMDLLWLLPGIVPGVIALVVDFSSGAIYVGGRSALRLAPDGRLAVRLPRSAAPARVELRLVTASHRVLAQRSVWVGPATPEGQSIDLVAPRPTRERMYLEIQNETGATARFPTSFEVVSS